MHLLHPGRDSLNYDITVLEGGHLAGLTPRGWFHIDWLHLNRPQLIAMRHKQAVYQRAQSLIEDMKQLNRQLQERIALQEQELDALRQKVRRLMGDDS
jgi:hypothetical protein